MGAEALAADVLSQSAKAYNSPARAHRMAPQRRRRPPPRPTADPSQVTLAQPWAQPTQPLPITPEDDPEGEPIGTLQGAIEDMQGRFNLNNLAHMVAAERPARFRIRGRSQQFQRLLVSVGLEPKWAGIARDWIDADDQPGEPDGAEDSRLHLADPALSDRQLADDEPERAHEPAGFRRRPVSQDRPLCDRAADRSLDDQHLHRARAGARESRRQHERRLLAQSRAPRERAQESAAFPT